MKVINPSTFILINTCLFLVRKSIKGSSCATLNQKCKSIIHVEVPNTISKELNITGNVWRL